jgi:hypothetical protein
LRRSFGSGWLTKVNSVEIKVLLTKEVIIYKIIQTFYSLSLLSLTKKPLDIIQPHFAAREYLALQPCKPQAKEFETQNIQPSFKII